MRKRQPPRRVLLAKIHIAATKMGLDEDTYRSMLHRYTGKTSASELTNTELRYVVTQVERDFGLNLSRPKGKTAGQIAKIKALLTAKGQRDGVYIPISYAEAILKQQCGLEKLEWANGKQLRAVITALIIAEKRAEG